MRNSDRWVTPGVVITALLVLGVVVLFLIAAVAFVTDRGHDADPMLRLIAEVGTLAGVLLTAALQLANRASTAKTERNTGVLASAVYEVADAMPRPRPANRHADPDDTLLLESRAAPAPRGS